MKYIPRKRTVFIALTLIICIALLSWISIRPSNERVWATDQAVLPHAEINGEQITIRNIRNFTYTSTTNYTPSYYDKTFDLSKIRSVDYIVEPFSDWEGSAHTFLTFGFGESESTAEYVSISVEIRKEQGESFSALKGLLKQYELMYVIADERDVIKLRTNYRKDEVFLYPVKADKPGMQQLFLSMIERANKLYREPEFYNTLTNTCTTNIVKHVNEIVTERKVPLSYKVLFPGYSDQLAYDLGLIDTALPFEEMRATYKINEKAETFADDPEFSVKIRR
ncbi:MAG TPA: DUF4105 domain-containing protein [Candidatus Paceibacterota bacterium]|nr:DUF4105 domain-containing protein [Candidatus Paceibacterota bacterium]